MIKGKEANKQIVMNEAVAYRRPIDRLENQVLRYEEDAYTTKTRWNESKSIAI